MAAPSSPSSSCEIVDLAVAATLGDATSQLFFSKDGGGGDLSWPEAAAIESTLTNKESLVALCDKYGVPRELEPVCAGKIAACNRPTEGQGSNALCIYADALEAGLRFPMPVFYGKLLRHYDLAPSQLTPNAWAYMAAFLQRCKDAGVEEQQVSAFTYFFSLCAHKHKTSHRGGTISASAPVIPASSTAVCPPSTAGNRAPPSLQGMEITPGTSFDGASGSSEISLPPGIWTGNSDYEYDMVRMQGEQRDNQIAQLQVKLQESEAKSRESEALDDKFVEYLYMKSNENDLLKKKHARLIEEQAAVVARVKAERAADVAKLQEEHASAVLQLTKHLNDEHAASIARLNEEHAADLARVKEKHAAEVAKLNQTHDAAVTWLMEEHAVDIARMEHAAEEAAANVVQDAKKDIVLALFPDLDASLL
ncbi:unnamed protein product [Miscanthus lutarioriparius]|uniref:Transposase (putative) gypsy type domain-containing protein n=1 Tax=Miscanthus lutarioriparius TaxID=422564 RepID=A0A811QQT8_9POAL|nr:unnamed protein product [Miscanthus lutarioriparius]